MRFKEYGEDVRQSIGGYGEVVRAWILVLGMKTVDNFIEKYQPGVTNPMLMLFAPTDALFGESLPVDTRIDEIFQMMRKYSVDAKGFLAEYMPGVIIDPARAFEIFEKQDLCL